MRVLGFKKFFILSVWCGLITSQNFSAWALDIPGFSNTAKPKPTATPIVIDWALKSALPPKCQLYRKELNLKPWKFTEPEKDLPFWKVKKNVYDQIIHDHKIIVSVNETEEGKNKALRLTTAGLINSPLAFTFDRITHYDQFTKVISYIQESKFDPTTNNLYLHGALLGFHIKMTLNVSEYKISDRERRVMFEVISGGLQGMKGEINVLELADPTWSDTRTEISMKSYYEAAKIPIPRIILSWGLEFAGQRAASSMRQFVEDDYAKCKTAK